MEFIIALSKIAGEGGSMLLLGRGEVCFCWGGGKYAFADVDAFGKLSFVNWKINIVYTIFNTN